MTSWSYRPPPAPSSRREWIAAARDLAIIAVCVVILGFALLAFLGPAREVPARATGPAAAHVTI
jgi:hypothetical protein